MTTAQEIINDAAGMAGILATGQPVGDAMNETSLRRLNQMLAAWESDGIYLGVPALDNSDDVLVEAADISAITYGLTAELYMQYGRPARADVLQTAATKKATLQAKYYRRIELKIPAELQTFATQNILTGQ